MVRVESPDGVAPPVRRVAPPAVSPPPEEDTESGRSAALAEQARRIAVSEVSGSKKRDIGAVVGKVKRCIE
jgi:hypothetical protein